MAIPVKLQKGVQPTIYTVCTIDMSSGGAALRLSRFVNNEFSYENIVFNTVNTEAKAYNDGYIKIGYNLPNLSGWSMTLLKKALVNGTSRASGWYATWRFQSFAAYFIQY